MKRSKLFMVLGVVFLLTSLTVVSVVISYSKSANEAKEKVDEFYSLVKLENYESAASLFHENFFKTITNEEFLGMLEVTNKELGNIDNYTLVNSNLFNIAGIEEATLVYEVNRTNFSSTETFVLRRDKKSNSFSFIGYYVNSAGFTKEDIRPYLKS